MTCQLIKLNYFILNSLIKLFQKLLYGSFNNDDIKKILVFRTGELGDNLCALPAINMIKENFKDSKIDMLVRVGEKSLVSFEALLKDGIIENYIDYTNVSKKNLLDTLKSNQYDLVIQLPQNMTGVIQQLRDMVFYKVCGIKYGFGWSLNSNLFLKKYQDRCVESQNEVDRLLSSLELNGLKKIKEYPLNIKDEDIDIVENFLKIKSIDDKHKNLAFVIGAKISPKEWDIKNFEIVAKYFIDRDYKIVLIGGSEDQEKAQYLVSSIKTNIYNACGVFTPIQSIVLLKNCFISLTNDTGPMHMSASIGTPIVALFSSWSYDKKWYPDNDKSVVIRKELECSICYDRSCANNICMQNISTVEVIKAIEQLIKSENGN